MNGLAGKLAEYDPGSKRHDDECDSAAYGLIVWMMYGESVTQRGIIQVAMLVLGDNAYSEVRMQTETQVAGF